ncbi:GNAT family N-acetyltransferase [Thalassotalea marina]|uniref:N-acetyltransferase n=1 Tax=Thalassotalea marina TaxID=1673741 RepID=A0A919BHG2_9GAMM|nr:GNAT family N-acetyltransferase [Thalassotalea marina]GHF91599.1 N-acetyltransferase [Thalassotalea marina]
MKPNFYGKRVLLRSICSEDTNDLFEIYGDVRTMEFASDPVFKSKDTINVMLKSIDRLEILGKGLEWAIVAKATLKVIGTCGLHSFCNKGRSCEVGCLLNSLYWRQGYMSEALCLLFSHAKLLGIETLYADIDEDNFRSQAFFSKLGFIKRNGYFLRVL